MNLCNTCRWLYHGSLCAAPERSGLYIPGDVLACDLFDHGSADPGNGERINKLRRGVN